MNFVSSEQIEEQFPGKTLMQKYQAFASSFKEASEGKDTAYVSSDVASILMATGALDMFGSKYSKYENHPLWIGKVDNVDILIDVKSKGIVFE